MLLFLIFFVVVGGGGGVGIVVAAVVVVVDLGKFASVKQLLFGRFPAQFCRLSGILHNDAHNFHQFTILHSI